MPELVGLLEKAELAISSSAQLADASKIAPLAAATALLRRRLDYPEDILLVALAGGTGSGKSSLLNALAGAPVAEPGGVRPTTDRPLAVASQTPLDRMGGYLSALGITDIAVAEVPSWLCLVDLPDTDSVDLDHRLQVDALVAKVDLVIWVVDPEKYRDAALHHSYLKRLSGHSTRFLFALNQIDRVDPAVRAKLVEDFVDALAEDGIESPAVVATSAAPPAGPPIGADQLLEALEERRNRGLYSKLLSDLDEAVEALMESAGRSGVDFEDRAGRTVGTATSLIASGQGADASDVLIELLEEVGEQTGGVTADRIGSVAARVPRRVQRMVESPDTSQAAEAIERDILTPVREVLRERALAIALITDLSLSVAEVRTALGV